MHDSKAPKIIDYNKPSKVCHFSYFGMTFFVVVWEVEGALIEGTVSKTGE